MKKKKNLNKRQRYLKFLPGTLLTFWPPRGNQTKNLGRKKTKAQQKKDKKTKQ